jgi:biotin carboxylase
MILGAGPLQLPAILTAKEMGLYVLTVDIDPNAPGFRYADDYAVISTVDVPEVVRYAEKSGIDGVMTLASDSPVRTVAAVAKRLGLVGLDEAAALNATNKAFMRDALRRSGVPIPVYYKAADYREYLAAIRHFTSPCVVKPDDNSGSRGIFLISDPADSALVDSAFDYGRKSSHGGGLLIEEYMRGPEVSVETLSMHGVIHAVAMTDKLTTGAPHFVEMGHSEPSRLPMETQERIISVAKAAVRAIGICDGPSHTEVIATEDGPKVVELGARLGGDCITTHLVPLSTGVDMVRCSIDIALGNTPDITAKYQKGAAIRYFSAGRGRIVDISGVKLAEAERGIRHITLTKGVGDLMPEIQSSADRIGFVIAQDDSAEQAVWDCESAVRAVAIRIR